MLTFIGCSQANKQRSVGATNLNRASSRSHAVLTIEVSMIDRAQNTSTRRELLFLSFFDADMFFFGSVDGQD